MTVPTDSTSPRRPGLVALSRIVHGVGRLTARTLGGSFGRYPTEPPVSPAEGRVPLAAGDMEVLRWEGDRPPVLMLHGLDGNPWMWARLPGLLGARQVLAPALRGHGRSTLPVDDCSFDAVSSDLLELLDRLDLGRIHLVGHSWGGKAAFHLAAAAPDRFASLVLADPVSPRGYNALLRAFPILAEAALYPERREFDDAATWEEGARDLVFLRAGDELDRRFWCEMFRRTPEGRYVPRLPHETYVMILHGHLAEDLSALAPRIACPTLILQPTMSVSFMPGELRYLRRGIRDAQLAKVTGDHTFPLSNPIETATVLNEFWERVAAAG